MRNALPPLTAFICALSPALARAHDGHGLFGAHWHATDTLGFVALAAVIGLALWCFRGGR